MTGAVSRIRKLAPAGLAACLAGAWALPAAVAQGSGAVETALAVSAEAPARLVLAYWPSGGWMVRQSGRNVELTLPGADLDVSVPDGEQPLIGGAVDSISTGTGPDATYLRLALACDCTIAVQGDGQRMMIDVVGADLAAGPIRADAGPAPSLAPAPARRPSVAAAAHATAGPAADPSPPHAGEPMPASAPGQDAAKADGAAARAPTAAAKPSMAGPMIDVEAARARLLDQLRLAAESGFVTLRPDSEPSGQTAAETAPAAPEAASHPGTARQPATGGADAHGTDGELADGGHAAPAGGGTGQGESGQVVPPGGASPPAHDADHAAPAIPAPPQENTQVANAGAHGTGAVPGLQAAAGHGAEADARGPSGDPGPLIPAEPGPAGPPDGLVKAEAGVACLDIGQLQLPDALPPEMLIPAISELRRGLLGEFDRPDPSVVDKLARLYIAHGMGTEALGLLEELGARTPDAPVLAALAMLAEDQPLPQPNILAVPGCKGQHALWRALDAALAGRDAEAVRHEAGASGALEQMTRGLRGRTAARLGLAAARQGDRLAAHRLLAMSRRGVGASGIPGGVPGAELLALLEAADAGLRGEMGLRREKLAQLRGSRSAAGVEALFEMARDAIAGEGGQDHGGGGYDGPPAGVDLLRLDLGALALSGRGTALGQRAFLAELRLTGLTFGRDAAFELLEYGHGQGMLDDRAYREALAATADSPVMGGDKQLAIVYERTPGRFALSLEDPMFRRALARSYTALGAPALGEAVLRGGDADGTPLPMDFARAYLDGGAVADARRIARTLPAGPGRSALDARIALAEGDRPTALAALEAAHAPAADRAAVAWSSGDWRGVLSAWEGASATQAPGSAADRSGGGKAAAGNAARIAFASLRQGQAAPPPEALALAEADPILREGLAAMYARIGGGPDGFGPEAVPQAIETLNAETRMLEALLNDG